MQEWLKDAIFYQVYPQSFYDSNGDGIGDLQGVIAKLDYIRDMGCNAIWLNPCFVSPFADAGYDVADYYKVAPRYGTNADMRELFSEVHKRGMHILLDLVPGHTSIEHPWFKASMEAKKNEYWDRYIWTNSVWDKPEKSCLCGFAPRDGNCVLNFFSCQPALNYGFNHRDRPWQEPPDGEGPKKTIAEMKNVMRFWLDMGCDGFRVDMAGTLVKYDRDSSANIALWQDITSFLYAEYPNAVMVSEWGEPDHSIAGGFQMDFLLHFGPSHYNDLFHSDEPYFSHRGKGDASEFVKYYTEIDKKAGDKGFICVPSGNHDMRRLSYGFDEDEIKIVFAFLLSLPGVPFIYYGDEIGMRYVEGLDSVEGGYNRTGSRSPMQWNSEKNAGFSAGKEDQLYIKLDPSKDRPTVEGQLHDPNSILGEVRRLISIRRETKSLGATGKIEFVYAEQNTYPLAYIRHTENEKLLIVINPSDREASFPYDGKLLSPLYVHGESARQDGNAVVAPPRSASFIHIQ